MITKIKVSKDEFQRFNSVTVVLMIIMGAAYLALPILALTRIPYVMETGMPDGESVLSVIATSVLVLLFLSYLTVMGVGNIKAGIEELRRRQQPAKGQRARINK